MICERIRKRCVDEANYIIETHATLRQTAKKFEVSKSTVHKDVREKLLWIDVTKVNEVDKVLTENYNESSIRGGEATRAKYKRMKGK